MKSQIRTLATLLIPFTMLLPSCRKESFNLPPTVTFGANFPQRLPRNFVADLVVEAKDEDGEIERVDWYMDDEWLANDDAAPFSLTFSTRGLTVGPHTLKVMATDNEGAITVASRQLEIRGVSTGPVDLPIGHSEAIDDPRLELCGDFTFLVTKTWWSVVFGNGSNTELYDGYIRPYVIGDELVDECTNSVTDYASDRVSIKFHPTARIITPPIVATTLQFIDLGGYHFSCTGAFVGTDSLYFLVSNLGGSGLGYQYQYEAVGWRKH